MIANVIRLNVLMVEPHLLARDDCLAFMQNAILNPPSSPPLSEWIAANHQSLEQVFDRADFLRLKHRGMAGVIFVLERFGRLDDSDTSDSLSFDEQNCRYCGADLFWALPGQTSRDEIIRFAKLLGNDRIAADGWIHPGVYCRNGCTTRLFNFGNRGLWDKLESDRKSRETASITVESNSEPLSNFKIHLDRYIRRTAPRDTAPPRSEYIELEPGDHTIVVRDFDAHDPNRRESNTLKFNIAEDEQIRFAFSIVDGSLEIRSVGRGIRVAQTGMETRPCLQTWRCSATPGRLICQLSYYLTAQLM